MNTTPVAGFLAAILAVTAIEGSAQDEFEEVLHVVDRLFDGMRSKDEQMLSSVFATGARVGDLDADSFIHRVLSTPAHLDEVTFAETVRVDGDLAMAWTPYNIFIDDEFHHCGVDLFVLKRVDSAWQITALEDTRRTEACDRKRRE